MILIILKFVFWIGILLVSVTLHEYAHGRVALFFGDHTAEYSGRLSLNPLRHIDPLWTVLYPLIIWVLTGFQFTFGMAKPVPVDFSQLRKPKQHMIWVALAGPVTNIALAAGTAWIARLLPDDSWPQLVILGFVYLNIVLAVFNLLPIPPLDGGRVMVGILPGAWARHYAQLERLGIPIVILLMITHLLDKILYPLVHLLCQWIGVPVLV